jgi:hypothetical protein
MIQNDRTLRATGMVRNPEAEDHQEAILMADPQERAKGKCLLEDIRHSKVMGLQVSGQDRDPLLATADLHSRLGMDLLVTIQVTNSKLQVPLRRL